MDLAQGAIFLALCVAYLSCAVYALRQSRALAEFGSRPIQRFQFALFLHAALRFVCIVTSAAYASDSVGLTLREAVLSDIPGLAYVLIFAQVVPIDYAAPSSQTLARRVMPRRALAAHALLLRLHSPTPPVRLTMRPSGPAPTQLMHSFAAVWFGATHRDYLTQVRGHSAQSCVRRFAGTA
jgi:hypothetical protein